MKENCILIMFVLSLFAAPLSAQQISAVKSSTTMNTERWYNFGEAMNKYHNTYLGDSSNLCNPGYIFPDSTILVDCCSTYYAANIHMLGDVLDVTSGYFNDPNLFTDPNELFLTSADPYYLDSLNFWFIYYRNITSVVDSIIFEVAVNNISPELSTSWFCCTPSTGLAVANNLGTDTVLYKDIPYFHTTNELNLSGKFRYAFPLTNPVNHIAFPCAGLPMVAEGKYVVVGIQFKPGFTWIPNVDTLNHMNAISFRAYKESAGTNPPFSYGYPRYTKRDYNISYILPKEIRYNMAGAWNGLLKPSYAFLDSTPAYGYEHHLLYYKVRKAAVGIDEITRGNAHLSKIYPNPVIGDATFSYKLETPDNVEIFFSDINGRVVKSMNEGMQSSGIHTVKFDVSEFVAGLYSFTVMTRNFAASGKMSVVK